MRITDLFKEIVKAFSLTRNNSEAWYKIKLFDLYIIKYRGKTNINVEHVTKILNSNYKVIKNSEMNKYDSWIDFHNATAGQYKTGDDILVDLDG